MGKATFGTCILAMLGVSACSIAQITGRYISATDGLAHTFSVPAYTQITSASSSTSGSNTNISVSVNGALASDGQLTFEAYFRSASGSFDLGIIYARNGYTYNSSPPVTPGNSAIISFPSRSNVGGVTVVENGNTVLLTVPSAAVGYRSPAFVVVRYLPSNVSDSQAVGGLSASIVDEFDIDTELSNERIAIPSHPSGGTIGGFASFLIPPQTHRTPIDIPDSCPPRASIPKDTDIDDDGVNDWDYPVDKDVGNGFMVDLWGLDHVGPGADSYVVVVGRDTNGNGKLDGNEIICWIGACLFYAGRNDFWQEGNGTIHWVNRDPRNPRDPDNGR